MPFALIIIGIVLLVAAVRDKQDDLFKLVQGDFMGEANFIYWVVAILVIGAIGYIPKAKPLSTAFLGLVLVVLFLTKGNPKGIGGGFFDQFTKQLGTTTTGPVAGNTASTVSTVPGAVNSADWLRNLAPVVPTSVQ